VGNPTDHERLGYRRPVEGCCAECAVPLDRATGIVQTLSGIERCARCYRRLKGLGLEPVPAEIGAR
jgi:hypothetical protein